MSEVGWGRTFVKCFIVVTVLALAAWASYSVKRAWLAQSKGQSSVLAPATKKLEIVEEIRPAVNKETIPKEEAVSKKVAIIIPKSAVDLQIQDDPISGGLIDRNID